MVFSPGSRAIACFSAMGWPAAAAVFSTTPTVMPLMRHSARPMPPPWSARRASTVTRSTGDVSWALCEVMATLGTRPLSSSLARSSLAAASLHLAAGIAGELLAHEVGAVEDLVELVDAEDLEAADDGEHIRAFGRSVEEALRRYGQPFAALEAKRLASS